MKCRGIVTVLALMLARTPCEGSVSSSVRDSGVKGGIVVHLGCGEGAETEDLLLNDSFVVHGLDTSGSHIAKARAALRSRDLYGSVSVAQYNGKTLPYADNTVNLIVSDELGDVTEEEAMRVLAPLGVLLVGEKKIVKPWPENIDEWPQYLNGADNNAVAQDSVAGPPRLLQWVNSPVWCRSHMAIPTVASVVSGKGRLFSIEDAAPPDNPFLPAAFRLVVRDAFNGKELWSRKISRWEAVTMYIKCQPLQQQRRMAVVGDTLYCTPYACTCSMGAMFQGMNAYASLHPRIERSDQPIIVPRTIRLEKGDAYDKIGNAGQANHEDWPAYRHDGFRSGIIEVRISAELDVRWVTKLPTRPSAVTSTAGMVFVSDVDTHTLYALDDSSGATQWTFTADGRIDSPPTFYKGSVLFGSRDGWVYCLRASDGALVWRFKDLPDKLIGAFGQLESKWPVFGSVLVLEDTLYFAAGRSSYLDGGIFLYALDPRSGELLRSRSFYGPFSEDAGFPIGGDAGFKNDVLVTDGSRLYLRHKALHLDLTDASGERHILPTGGFLDRQPHHRTCWTLSPTISKAISGDIMVSNGKEYYEVQGFPIYANHSYFDPRKHGYTLFAGTMESSETTQDEVKKRRQEFKKGRFKGKAGKEIWKRYIPITGKAIAMAEGVLFVAGEPMEFDESSYVNYVAAYSGQMGGHLLAVSSGDGKLLAEYALSAAPEWDSIAIANDHLYICLEDGTVQCMGE